MTEAEVTRIYKTLLASSDRIRAARETLRMADTDLNAAMIELNTHIRRTTPTGEPNR